MAERTDITVLWGEPIRLIEVAAGSNELTNQDLHDTLNSNTKQASVADDSLENMDDEDIIASSGKQDLGGGVLVGISSTLDQAQVLFQATDPITTGTVTTGDTAGVLLTDTGADYVADGVKRGDWIVNFTDQSVTEILELIDLNNLRTRGLRNGTDNQFDMSDAYKIWPVEEAVLGGGNTNAIDSIGDPISPTFPTFGRSFSRTSSSSATLQELEDIQNASYEGAIWIDEVNGVDGTAHPAGNRKNPVKTTASALTRAVAEGLRTLSFIGAAGTLGSGVDVSAYEVVGESAAQTTLTLVSGCITENTEFKNLELDGVADGALTIINCHVEDLSGIGSTVNESNFHNVIFEPGTTTLKTLAGSQQVNFIDCSSGSADEATPVIFDFGGANGPPIVAQGWKGVATIQNCSDSNRKVSWGGDTGEINVDATITAGEMHFYGLLELNHTQTGTEDIHRGGALDPRYVRDIYRILGLDLAVPMTVTQTSRVAGTITQTITGDGVITSTVTRTA